MAGTQIVLGNLIFTIVRPDDYLRPILGNANLRQGKCARNNQQHDASIHNKTQIVLYTIF